MSGSLSRKLPPWAVRKVRELFDEQFEKDQQGRGREDGEVVGLPVWINTLADQLIEEADHPEWDGTKEDRLELSWLAMTAVLGGMERFARGEGDVSVAGTRELGAIREEVAVATGYSNEVSVRRRYVADQRERAAQGDRLRRKRAKEAEEAAEGESDS